MIARSLLLTLSLLAATAPQAADLPRQARITYEARLSGLPVGEAVQRWQREGSKYTLDTEITPILGSRIRYHSEGELTPAGLRPSSYGEFRGSSSTPRQQAQFDWRTRQVSYGPADALQSAPLDSGAQDLNTLPFQLAWLGTKTTANLQIITGRKLRDDAFTASTGSPFALMGKQTATRIWRAPDGDKRTEFWLATDYANLPVKIVRHDDKGELQLIAKHIEYQLE
ncbi:DUF3108 domain-containing protein [Chitinimonas viridis]|uniref:DUF3108 domain-containing protein n=1 Tax=Chitinimonas viridis TaxID=664880 RepID=A0ABT8B6V5_9NEIS|nr:DUF3108 domain-containing protein [Chitinimonas viridis]MDN3577987.1 DUF3108 domain-containing protein [Chitinimonas viridis]